MRLPCDSGGLPHVADGHGRNQRRALAGARLRLILLAVSGSSDLDAADESTPPRLGSGTATHFWLLHAQR